MSKDDKELAKAIDLRWEITADLRTIKDSVKICNALLQQ